MLDFMLPHTTVTHLQFLCEASAQKGLCHANYLSVIICVGDVFRGGSICKSHEWSGESERATARPRRMDWQHERRKKRNRDITTPLNLSSQLLLYGFEFYYVLLNRRLYFYQQILGKFGRVQKVYSDGDLRVLIGAKEWTINPKCCALAVLAENSNMKQQDRSKIEDTTGRDAIVSNFAVHPTLDTYNMIVHDYAHVCCLLAATCTIMYV